MTPRDALHFARGRKAADAELIPPDLTPALLLTSPEARRQFSDALAERGVALPLQADPRDPGAIVDADGALVATVTGFVTPECSESVAKLIVAAITACTIVGGVLVQLNAGERQ